MSEWWRNSFCFESLRTLSAHTTKAWHDPQTLSRILQALERRPGDAAKALLHKISGRLHDFDEPAQQKAVEGSLVEVEQLRSQLDAALDEIITLRLSLEELTLAPSSNKAVQCGCCKHEHEQRQPPSSDLSAAFVKLGLLHTIPPYAIRPLRNVYRKALHPDYHPASAAEYATQRFIEVEEAFARIEASMAA